LHTEGIHIESVYALCNPILASQFSNHREILQQRHRESPVLFNRRDWILLQKGSQLRSYAHARYMELGTKYAWNDPDDLVPIVPVVHGTDYDIGLSIAAQGFCALASLDAGFYGKGIYFTTFTNYAIPYFIKKTRPAVLVSLGVFGNAYPVIEAATAEGSLLGQPIMSGYQSHYVVTKKDGTPITDTHGTEYNELVVSQESQVVSIYLVKISTKEEDLSKMQKLLQTKDKRATSESDI